MQINVLTNSRPKRRPNISRLYADFLNEKMSDMQSILVPYSTCRIYQGNSYWYVEYYFLNPVTGDFDRFKEYFDINRIHDLKARKIYAQEMVKFINEKLATGFNPFECLELRKSGGTIMHKLDKLFDLMCEEATETTRKYYLTIFNRFKKYIFSRSLEAIGLGHINILIVEDFKTWMIGEQLSKKSINVSLSHLSLFWVKAMKQQWVFANPFAATSVDRVKKTLPFERNKEDKYEPLTFEELKLVMSSVDLKFKRFLYFILYAWARPVEILRLTISDIDLDRDFIRFRSTDTKNGHGAYVQIVPPLKKLLLEMDLSKYDSDMHLFSLDFQPGKAFFSAKIVSLIWYKTVIQKLGVLKRMYALKHTGNILYLMSNKGKTDLKWQQMQNRHLTSAMTDRYNRKLGAYFIEMDNVNFQEF